MSPDAEVLQVAAELRVSVGLLLRRMRQVQVNGEVTLPESAVLSRLDRGGPSTPGGLAQAEQISQQSMGATVAGLEARGLVARAPDPEDGRRAVLTITAAGRAVAHGRRDARTRQLAEALAATFTDEEIARLGAAAPLLERLAQSI
jgi:DNA-binding MarR family transcriptional regulator